MRVGYAFLLRCIRAMWKPKGDLKVVSLGYDFFIVKFASAEEREAVLQDGRFSGIICQFRNGRRILIHGCLH